MHFKISVVLLRILKCRREFCSVVGKIGTRKESLVWFRYLFNRKNGREKIGVEFKNLSLPSESEFFTLENFRIVPSISFSSQFQAMNLYFLCNRIKHCYLILLENSIWSKIGGIGIDNLIYIHQLKSLIRMCIE